MVQGKANTKKILSLIKSFLKTDDVKYSTVSDNCLEVYIQANNVNLIVLIYISNGHIIIRTPEFIRNVQLKKMDIMLFISQVMNDVLDIRFEISEDGKSISSSCQHIIEDGTITKNQFDLMMMIVVRITDDVYPKLMQLIYAGDDTAGEHDAIEEILNDDELMEELERDLELDDELDDALPQSDDDDHKIN